MSNVKRKSRPVSNASTGSGGNSVNLSSSSGHHSGNNRYSTNDRNSTKQQTPQSPPDNIKLDSSLAQGAYSNANFMFGIAPLIGSLVQVQLNSGSILEGVFSTFSPDFKIAVEKVSYVKLGDGLTQTKIPTGACAILTPDSVVSITSDNVSYRVADFREFKTDTAISDKINGETVEEKVLEPWEAPSADDTDIDLDHSANGWDPNEMFRKNENQFGVMSTFEPSMSSYTVALKQVDSEAEAKAERLAAEIENNPVCRDRLELENGDEEALFAAVERPSTTHRERDHEREREREKPQHRDTQNDHRGRYERDRDDRSSNKNRSSNDSNSNWRETMSSDRYITKQLSSVTSSSSGIRGNSAATSGGAQAQQTTSGGRGSERYERDVAVPHNSNNSSNQSNISQNAAGGSTTSLASSTGRNIKDSNSSITQINANATMGGTTSGGGSLDNNKYGSSGTSMIKRKSGPQSNKLIRGGTTINNNNNNNNNQHISSGNNNQNNGNKSGGSSSSSSYSSSINNSSSYSSYNSIMHGSNQYRNSRSNVNDSNPKPMSQRNMRPYQTGGGASSQSNASLHCAPDINKQSSGPHSTSSSSNSPPLPAATGGNQANNQMPQRSTHRGRDNQLQDLRQFGHDFQLANTNNSSMSTPSRQQQQQAHRGDNAAAVILHPQPSLTPPMPKQLPPQQTQQQQPQHMHTSTLQQQQSTHHNQQQQVQQQQPTQLPPPQHVHVHVAAHVVPQHHMPMQMYVQAPPPHLGPQTTPPPALPTQQQQPHLVQQQQHMLLPHAQPKHSQSSTALLAADNVQATVPQQQQQQPPTVPHHLTLPPPPVVLAQPIPTAPNVDQQQHQHGFQGQQLQLQQQPPPQQVYLPGMQTTPTSPKALEPNLIHHQLPIQQQQQQFMIGKTDGSNATPSVINPVPAVVEKLTTPPKVLSPEAGNHNSGGGSTTGVTANANSVGSTSNVPTPPVKKSMLNPSAKPFTPRGPSTPNPSRPHTPMTPVQQLQPLHTPTNAHVAALANSGPFFIMPPQQAAAYQVPQAHPHPHGNGGQNTRGMRRSQFSGQPQMQISANTATGQPLLSGAPLPQFIHYPQTTHPSHFQTQPFAPMIRMFPEQTMQFIQQTPPPPTTPSPGQPHQNFHPSSQQSSANGAQQQQPFAGQTPPQPAYQVVCPLVQPQLISSPYYPATPQHMQQQQPYILMPQHPSQHQTQ